MSGERLEQRTPARRRADAKALVHEVPAEHFANVGVVLHDDAMRRTGDTDLRVRDRHAHMPVAHVPIAPIRATSPSPRRVMLVRMATRRKSGASPSRTLKRAVLTRATDLAEARRKTAKKGRKS